jgi:hypothetical protein
MVSTSKLCCEIRCVELCGKTNPKLAADAGFVCGKAPMTVCMMSEKIKYTLSVLGK